ncbi:MAG: stage V sporulation protein AA [Bacillota bacterium]
MAGPQPYSDVFLRVRQRITAAPGELLQVRKLAEIAADQETAHIIGAIPIRQVRQGVGTTLVIPAFDLVKAIKQQMPAADIRLMGETDTIVSVQAEETNQGDAPWWGAVGVAILLSIGAFLAIMNFQTDVAMPEVHRTLFYMLTGARSDQPLVLQIPYAIGVGLGIAIFFNRLSRHHSEPSPLEVEMHLYDKSVSECFIAMEEQRAKDEERRKDRPTRGQHQ